MNPALAAGLQIALVVGILAVLYVPVGDYIAKVYTSSHDLRVEAENVNASPVAVVRPLLVTVENHVVAIANHPSELDSLAWVLGGHSVEVLDEGLLAICNHRIVLDVGVPYVFLNGLGRLALVEHEVVEGLRVLLVPLEVVHEGLSNTVVGGHLTAASSRLVQRFSFVVPQAALAIEPRGLGSASAKQIGCTAPSNITGR